MINFEEIMEDEKEDTFMNINDFINRLEMCCKEQGMTRTAWAKKIGFSESTIRNWIRSNRLPSVDIVYNFANYFGVTMEYLLNCPETEIDDTDFLMLLKMKKLSAEQKKMLLAVADSFINQSEKN